MPKGVRRKENRTITISLPKSLVADIDALARTERRSRSNWIVIRLEKLVKEKTKLKKVVANRNAFRYVDA
jgi:metal-responsive CopG/Arc/MetJ family transcriptional regulator